MNIADIDDYAFSVQTVYTPKENGESEKKFRVSTMADFFGAEGQIYAETNRKDVAEAICEMLSKTVKFQAV